MALPGFLPFGGRVRYVRRKVKASQVFSIGDVCKETSGADTVEPAATDAVFACVYMDKDRATTDSDYASTPFRTFALVTPETQWYANVETGTAAAATTGTNVDLASADGVDVGTTTKQDFHVDKVLNSTTIVGHFNATIFTLPGA